MHCRIELFWICMSFSYTWKTCVRINYCIWTHELQIQRHSLSKEISTCKSEKNCNGVGPVRTWKSCWYSVVLSAGCCCGMVEFITIAESMWNQPFNQQVEIRTQPLQFSGFWQFNLFVYTFRDVCLSVSKHSHGSLPIPQKACELACSESTCSISKIHMINKTG